MIPPKMKFICRELEKKDLKNNFPDILADLTVLGKMNDSKTKKLYETLKKNEAYKIFVVVEEGKSHIVGSATLFIEQKFIRNYAKVGHVEDVVVDKNYRKKGIGKILISKIIIEAKRNKCAKITLCCQEKNVQFYEKMGLKRKGVEMVVYFDERSN